MMLKVVSARYVVEIRKAGSQLTTTIKRMRFAGFSADVAIPQSDILTTVLTFYSQHCDT